MSVSSPTALAFSTNTPRPVSTRPTIFLAHPPPESTRTILMTPTHMVRFGTDIACEIEISRSGCF